jgi:hypothetical protein
MYFDLRRRNRNFAFEAHVVVDNGDGGDRETLCTRLYWQLSDDRRPKLEYYSKLFGQMEKIIDRLPPAPGDRGEILKGLLGARDLPVGLKIVRRQMRRFEAA